MIAALGTALDQPLGLAGRRLEEPGKHDLILLKRYPPQGFEHIARVSGGIHGRDRGQITALSGHGASRNKASHVKNVPNGP